MKRPRFVVLVLLVALQTGTPVWAWGKLGHRVTARIAERHLNPAAREAVKALLDKGEGRDVGRHLDLGGRANPLNPRERTLALRERPP